MPPLRPDGRPAGSLRPLSCELGCLRGADGSALWRSGATLVLAAVHGPLAPRAAPQERAGGARISVVVRSGPQGGTGGDGADAPTYEREWEHLLAQVLAAAVDLRTHPRAVVQVVLQILLSDGSLLAACLHAAVAALMDAGLELLLLPTAATCLIHADAAVDGGDKRIISLDPTALEEQSAGTMVVVTTPEDKILATYTSFVDDSVETLLECCSAASRAGPAIVAFWRLVWEQKSATETQTLWAL